MDERVEWQLGWLEQAVSRVIGEAKELAKMVEGGGELVEDLVQTAMALHMQMEAVKGKLTPKSITWEEAVEKKAADFRAGVTGKPTEVKEEIGVEDLSFEGTVAGASDKSEKEGEKTFDLPPGTVCMTEEELASMGTTIPEGTERKEEV